MSTKNKILIAIMFIILLMMVYSEQNQKVINWTPSYSVKHKIPFGSYIAHEEAKSIFKDKLQDVNSSPYIFFQKNKEAEGTFVLYNGQVALGETNWNALKDWVSKGNNLFISSNQFEEIILDSLHLIEKSHFDKKLNAKVNLTLNNPLLKPKDSILFDKTYYSTYFETDSLALLDNFKFLGEISSEKKDSLYNFVSIKHGKGKIYLHAFPYAFTNYFILKDNNLQYFEGLLSYINIKQPVYWNTHYQTGAKKGGIFKYLLQNKSFLWAYRILFFGLLLYIIFEGKRKQRAIPIVKPLKNETISFTKTIADMYLVNKEHKLIAQMHIKHFMEYVRNKLKLDTRKWNKLLMKKIAEKSSSDIDDVKALFKMIDDINNTEKVLAQQVIKLEKLINKVKK